MLKVSAKNSIINYAVLCDTSKEVKPFLSPIHTHTQVDCTQAYSYVHKILPDIPYSTKAGLAFRG